MSRHELTRPICGALIVSAVSASLAWSQALQTVTASRLASTEASLDVQVRFGVGELQLGPTHGRALYQTEIRYLEDKFQPLIEYDARAQTLVVGVKTKKGGVKLGSIKEPQQLRLLLSPNVPIDLSADLGAAEADIQLGGLLLKSVDVKAGAADARISFEQPNRIACSEMTLKTGAAELRVEQLGNSRCKHVTFHGGAGDITLDFTGDWGGNAAMDADVKFTLGALTLRLPRDLGVTVEVSRFLASFDQAGFSKRGSQYVSAGYEQAAATLHLSVKAFVGDIDVVWIDR
jgi:hypothetical protein